MPLYKLMNLLFAFRIYSPCSRLVQFLLFLLKFCCCCGCCSFFCLLLLMLLFLSVIVMHLQDNCSIWPRLLSTWFIHLILAKQIFHWKVTSVCGTCQQQKNLNSLQGFLKKVVRNKSFVQFFPILLQFLPLQNICVADVLFIRFCCYCIVASTLSELVHKNICCWAKNKQF